MVLSGGPSVVGLRVLEGEGLQWGWRVSGDIDPLPTPASVTSSGPRIGALSAPIHTV